MLLTSEERKKLVEEGLKQFHQSEEFRKLLTWLLQEQEKAILLGVQKKINKKYNIDSRLTKDEKKSNDVLDWFLSIIKTS